ncbi:MAG TPA: hypothetical protein VGI43_16920 [Mucilaginibacter sp.]|jgi:hypothetical protein
MERKRPKARKKSDVGSPKPAEENKSEIENPKSEIEQPLTTHNSPLTNMEVHHHPEIEKKTFKEYLLEGLMIFIAVMMGFIAENAREHITERNRENEYMESLVKDLKLDTAILQRAIDFKEQRVLAIDSILTYFTHNIKAKKMPLNMFGAMRRSQWDMFFIHYSGTIDQLKNSGGLRLIRKKDIIDSVEMYYQQVQRSETRNSSYFANQQASFAMSEKLWNAVDNINSFRDYYLARKPYPDTGYVSINTIYLNEYLNNLVRIRMITGSDRNQFAIKLRDDASRLIKLIKKEYQLE